MQQNDMLGYSKQSTEALQLHLNVHEPIELDEMADSFKAIGYLYSSYIKGLNPSPQMDIDERSYSLYIKSIENNCILADLCSLGVPFISQAEFINTFVDFIKNVKSTLSYFHSYGDSSAEAPDSYPYKKKSALAVAHITQLAAKNKDGELGISAIEYRETKKETIFNVNFDSEYSNQAFLGSTRYLQNLSSTESRISKNVVMQFFQVNSSEFKAKGRTGDRATIRSRHNKDLPVTFESDIDRRKLMSIIEDLNINPLRLSFLVDVFVETNVTEKPVAFRVVQVHDLIDDGSEIVDL